MAPQWAAFVGFTALVLTAFLVLARLSQRALRDPPTRRERRRPAAVDPAVGTTPPIVRVPVSEVQLDSLSTAALLGNVAITQGLFGAVLLGGAVAFAIPAWAFGLGSDALTGRALLWGVALGAGLWMASEAGASLVDAAGIEHDERLRGMLAPDTLGGWVVLLGVVLPIIAGVEELFFRAAAIGVVAAGLDTSPWAMVVVSSAAFGFGHGAQGRAGVVVTGVLGLVLGAAFVLTGSLVTVVVAHYLVNALEFLVHESWT
jgi:membrane protease YdiL (CAAX protease family)